MSDLKICRICLRTEAKMYNFNLCQLKFYYEEVNEEDGLPRYFCYECATILHKFHKFKEKCYIGQKTLKELKWKGPISYEVLYKIDREDLMLNSPLTIMTVSNRVKTFTTTDSKQKNESQLLPKIENVEVDYLSETSFTDRDDINELTEDEKINNDNDINIANDNELNTLNDCKINNENDNSDENNDIASSPTPAYMEAENGKLVTDCVELKDERRGKQSNVWKSTALNDKNNWKISVLSEDEALKEFRAKAEDKKYLAAAFKCTECFKGFSKKNMLDRHVQLRHIECLENVSAVEHVDLAMIEEAIQDTAVHLLSLFIILDNGHKPQLKDPSRTHNFFVSIILKDCNNLKRMSQLIQTQDVDSKILNFIRVINEVLNGSETSIDSTEDKNGQVKTIISNPSSYKTTNAFKVETFLENAFNNAPLAFRTIFEEKSRRNFDDDNIFKELISSKIRIHRKDDIRMSDTLTDLLISKEAVTNKTEIKSHQAVQNHKTTKAIAITRNSRIAFHDNVIELRRVPTAHPSDSLSESYDGEDDNRSARTIKPFFRSDTKPKEAITSLSADGAHVSKIKINKAVKSRRNSKATASTKDPLSDLYDSDNDVVHNTIKPNTIKAVENEIKSKLTHPKRGSFHINTSFHEKHIHFRSYMTPKSSPQMSADLPNLYSSYEDVVESNRVQTATSITTQVPIYHMDRNRVKLTKPSTNQNVEGKWIHKDFITTTISNLYDDDDDFALLTKATKKVARKILTRKARKRITEAKLTISRLTTPPLYDDDEYVFFRQRGDVLTTPENLQHPTYHDDTEDYSEDY